MVTKDYTFKTPRMGKRLKVLNRKASTRTTSARSMKYDYPGRFKSAHGQNSARWQMDGWRNNAETAREWGRSPEIWPDGELC